MGIMNKEELVTAAVGVTAGGVVDTAAGLTANLTGNIAGTMGEGISDSITGDMVGTAAIDMNAAADMGEGSILSGEGGFEGGNGRGRFRFKLNIPKSLRLKRLLCLLLVPFGLLLANLAVSFPEAAENLYSQGIYKALSAVFGFLSSIVPFSISEAMLFLLPSALVIYTVFIIAGVVRKKGKRLQYIIRFASTLLCIVSCTYFFFIASCGINYNRLTFAETNGLEILPSSAEELKGLCLQLVDSANSLRMVQAEDDSGVVTSSFNNMYEMADFAQKAYGGLAEEYPSLSGYTAKPKPVFFSEEMSYFDITGIYVPFFFEPNVNVDVVDYLIPVTMMHEITHYKGYMREDEANFVAYLACIQSGNDEFAYAGTMLAMRNSLNALYSADKELYFEAASYISDGVLRDMQANNEYWQGFKGPVAEASSRMNDAYLKANNQKAGVRSYGLMVDLLLADYRKNRI